MIEENKGFKDLPFVNDITEMCCIKFNPEPVMFYDCLVREKRIVPNWEEIKVIDLKPGPGFIDANNHMRLKICNWLESFLSNKQKEKFLHIDMINMIDHTDMLFYKTTEWKELVKFLNKCSVVNTVYFDVLYRADMEKVTSKMIGDQFLYNCANKLTAIDLSRFAGVTYSQGYIIGTNSAIDPGSWTPIVHCDPYTGHVFETCSDMRHPFDAWIIRKVIYGGARLEKFHGHGRTAWESQEV